MDKLTISVVMVARNAERTIEECLQSIRKNNPAEIIVIDGNSSDGTVEIARRYTERVYSDEGKGLGYARQLGAEQATQEYVAYVDSDVVLTENALSTMLAEFKNSDFIGIGARESPDKKCSTYWEWGQYQQDYHHRLRPRSDFLNTMAGLIRKETILRYKFDISEKYLDDFDLGIRLGREGYKFGTSSAIYYHRHQGRTDFRSYASYRFHLGWVMSRYIRKYGLWHIGFWAPVISLYWLGFFLIRGNLKMLPYLVVDGVVLNAGWVKGLFDLIWKGRDKGLK